MKKIIFFFLLTLGVTAGAFAQRWNQHGGDRDDRYENRGYQQQRQYGYGNYNQPQVVYSNHGNYGNYGNYNRMGERERQYEIARLNQEYDMRIDAYRRNRALSAYDRDRYIYDIQRERNSRISGLGGVLVGAVIGGLIGSAL